LAETSCETDEELDSFTMPSFALADVTNIELFSGGKLSELKYEDVREEILRSGLLNARSAGNS
jgi:hypothetical protein